MLTLDTREIKEGLREQGRNESIVWVANVDPAPVTFLDMLVYDEADIDTDISETHIIGTATVASPLIYLPNLHSLELDHTYRVEVLYDDGTSDLEFFFRVKCTR